MAYKFVAIIVSALLIFSGCAAIVKGRTQDVSIASNPAGAHAKIDGTEVTTPSVITLPSNKSYTVKVEKQGYEPASAGLTRHLSGWLWGNIIFGGLIGLIVDFAMGAAYKLKPETISVDLQKASPSKTQKR